MRTGSRQATETKRLSAGDLGPLVVLINHLSLAPVFPGDAVLNGADPVIRSPHHLGGSVWDGPITNRHSGFFFGLLYIFFSNIYRRHFGLP
ncbi:MAG: hypothetical protein WA461_00185 [Nitrososphaeraceae archaeon]